MNEVDFKFNELISFIEKTDYDALLEHILRQYISLPLNLQISLKRYLDKYPFWGRIDFAHNQIDFFERKAKDTHSHCKELKWLYENLEDYSSKLLLFSILNNWINFDIQTLKRTSENRFKHYFNLDLIPKANDEVFVDVGSYYGETTLDFINSYSTTYKRIYCYEITPQIIEVSKNNLKEYENIIFKEMAVKNKNGYTFIQENQISSSANQTINLNAKNANFQEISTLTKVKCTTLDRDIEEKITMIKMDIEGDEIEALKGAKNHIKNDTPKLLISVYHDNNHLWQIPKYIHKLNKNYKFYLRNYNGNYYPTEIVLFALPKC